VFNRNVVISGIGQSEVGRRLNRTGLSLTIDAVKRALVDAGLEVAEVDGIATYPGPDQSDPGYAGCGATAVIDAMGLQVDWFLGAGETSGQLGPVMDAALAVSAGLARNVIVFRTLTEGTAQKDHGRASVSTMPTKPAHWSEWHLPFGARMPTIIALAASRFFKEYGLTRRQLAQVALNARRNASLNPSAIYREPMTMADYLEARIISTPLCLFDCDVPVDGSTAVVVSDRSSLRRVDRPTVAIESFGCSLNGRASHDQSNPFSNAMHDSGAAMWNRTELTPRDVDVAELYDGFSLLTLMWLEGLQFCEVGGGGRFVESGERIRLDGQLPLNTQGGQLSGGRLHGLGFLHEACIQLWREGSERQAARWPRVAVVAAGGQTFAGCMLLSRDD
jgi:acetyl-CoA acetyltransferase